MVTTTGMSSISSEAPQENYNQAIERVLKSKTAGQIRNKYLSKLMYHRVWLAPVQKPRSHQNIVILDYDDTLLPTTFLDPEDEKDMENLVKIHKVKLEAVQE
jgi:hypothetical protein